MNLLLRALLMSFIACLSTGCSADPAETSQTHVPAGTSQPRARWIDTVENPALPRSDWEKKVLSVIGDMDRDPSRRHKSVTPEDGKVLRALVESTGAQRVVEVGTSTGYSDLWIALGLRATGGSLTTYEINPSLASIAEKNLKLAGVSDLVTVVVGDAHVLVKEYEGPIDVLFIDADKQGYVDYFKKLLPQVRPGGLILAHNPANLRNAPGYIEAVTENPELDTSFLLMGKKGIALTLKKR
jgi:predicted O-methyltransferase YrrM